MKHMENYFIVHSNGPLWFELDEVLLTHKQARSNLTITAETDTRAGHQCINLPRYYLRANLRPRP